jgi:hypothetical protein
MMTEYRIIDPLAEDRAREQQGHDEAFKLSRAHAHPNHRDAAREYLKSPSPDPVLRSQAIIDAYAPDAPAPTLSAEGEARLEWFRAQDAARSERPRTEADVAAQELREHYAALEAQGVRPGWRDPSDPRIRAQAWEARR